MSHFRFFFLVRSGAPKNLTFNSQILKNVTTSWRIASRRTFFDSVHLRTWQSGLLIAAHTNSGRFFPPTRNLEMLVTQWRQRWIPRQTGNLMKCFWKLDCNVGRPFDSFRMPVRYRSTATGETMNRQQMPHTPGIFSDYFSPLSPQRVWLPFWRLIKATSALCARKMADECHFFLIMIRKHDIVAGDLTLFHLALALPL